MFRGPHFIIRTMQAGTYPIFKVFGMTGPSSNRESNPQNLLVGARSPLSLPFTISRGNWGPIRHQRAPSGAPTLDPNGVIYWHRADQLCLGDCQDERMSCLFGGDKDGPLPREWLLHTGQVVFLHNQIYIHKEIQPLTEMHMQTEEPWKTNPCSMQS